MTTYPFLMCMYITVGPQSEHRPMVTWVHVTNCRCLIWKIDPPIYCPKYLITYLFEWCRGRCFVRGHGPGQIIKLGLMLYSTIKLFTINPDRTEFTIMKKNYDFCMNAVLTRNFYCNKKCCAMHSSFSRNGGVVYQYTTPWSRRRRVIKIKISRMMLNYSARQ